MITQDDRQFLEAFEKCALGAKCWTHEAHVRIGWLVLQEESSFDLALERIRQGIKRFNSTNNSIGYHETITVAFARIIDSRRIPADSWQIFCQKNQDLFDKSCLSKYYSSKILASVEARQSFVEPDVQPL